MFYLPEGLYGELGSNPIYYVKGFSKRHIESPEALVSEFGPGAWDRVTWLPAGGLTSAKQKAQLMVLAVVAVVILALVFFFRGR